MSKIPKLEWIIQQDDEEINKYLLQVSAESFRREVRELLIKDSGKLCRDEFAAKAMQGIMAGRKDAPFDLMGPKRIADFSYKLADAMLKASERKGAGK